MIIFKKIKYANFLSSGSYLTEIQLDKTELTIITGKNGAGKSTILDAISFVLFNKPFRKINKNQLINTIIKKNCVVEIQFQIGKFEYRVSRGIKPNIFKIYENEILIDQSALNVDYQEYFEKNILRCNHKSFCQIVILGSASYMPFLELTTQQRREITEDICDLEIFSVMNSLLKKEFSENNVLINEMNTEKRIILEKIKVYEDNVKRNNENTQDNIKVYKDKIFINKEKVADISINLIDIQNIQQEFNTLKIQNTQEESKITKFNTDISVYKKELSNNEKAYNFYHDHDQCSQCKQDINEEFKNTILKNIVNTLENIKLLVTSIEKNKFDTMEILKFLNKKMETLSEVGMKNTENLNMIKSFEREIKNWQEVIEDFKKKSNNNINILSENLENEINKINLEIDIREKEKSQQTKLLKLLKDDGIKSQIINNYITSFNKYVNYFLYEMDFMCEFYLDSEFNEVIKSRYRDNFSYASFSEGEKLRINLAILFTWREIAKKNNSINTNILIFDEILDSSLDYDGIESLFKIIKHLTKGSNTFIISHNPNSIDMKENSIEFQKVKGFSHITKKGN
jgi:DNA repair exonuclease SbcCD ATPase subunit